MTLIPSGVFQKYSTFADAMILELGEDCSLVYPDTLVPTARTVPTIKQQKTFLIEPVGEFARSADEYSSQENRETVRMRVYWDSKSFKKIAEIAVPQGGVMCIGKLAILPKIRKATALIIHKVTDGSHEEYRFEKIGEPQLHGLNNNYVMSIWAR